MKHQVTHISVHQSAKVVAVIYGLLGLVFVPFFWLMSALNPAESMPLLLTILFPVLYAVMGYLFSALSFFVYNLLAAGIGGVEFTLTPVDRA